MSSPFLASEVIEQITGRARPSAQCRMLEKLGIRYIRSGVGKPLVLLSSLDPATKAAAKERTAPRFDRIGGRVRLVK